MTLLVDSEFVPVFNSGLKELMDTNGPMPKGHGTEKFRYRLRKVLRDRGITVIVTKKFQTKRYQNSPAYRGLCDRGFGPGVYMIDIRAPGKLGPRALLWHEITHALGGNEFDAEIVEHLLQPGCDPDGLRDAIRLYPKGGIFFQISPQK